MAAKLMPIERVRNYSEQQFEAAVLCDRPLILEGAVREWNAFSHWSPEYLAKLLGSLRIHVKTSPSHLHPDFVLARAQWDRPLLLRMLAHLRRRRAGLDAAGRDCMAFADFLRLLVSSTDGYRYLAGAEELGLLRGGEWNEALSALRPDYEVPRYVPPARLDSAAFWVSAKGVRSHLHYDGNCLHNLNAQVTGSKHVQLYSPQQMGKLYPYLFTSGHPYTFSQVNVEDVDARQFPLFSGAEGYEGTLEGGDLLFIPAYWYHSFKHLGNFNTNINFWWRADFVRLSPVSARDYLGGAAIDVLSKSSIPPFWLSGWFRKMESYITREH